MTIKRYLINNFILRIAFKKMLPYMPREMIQSYMGFESLSPIEQFAAKGYNDLLFSNLNLDPDDSVLVLGGYLGYSISKFRDLYNCNVIAVEPIPEFAKTLREVFRIDKKVQILEFAAFSENGNLKLGLEGESTGGNSNSRASLEVESRDISQLLVEMEELPKVIEMNIEGGEYECLERLVETGVVGGIEILLVQFHRYELKNELSRAQIRINLAKTHTCIFEFPWVWERWDRKS
jgi:FkbM family methyltransferase